MPEKLQVCRPEQLILDNTQRITNTGNRLQLSRLTTLFLDLLSSSIDMTDTRGKPSI